jgi:hypothetical protein
LGTQWGEGVSTHVSEVEQHAEQPQTVSSGLHKGAHAPLEQISPQGQGGVQVLGRHMCVRESQ